ncbi:MAG: Gfo/Idh/MocA family oxidoreductase [Pseudomonadota bacterium]
MVRIGLIGYGNIGRAHHATLDQISNCAVAAVCSRTEIADLPAEIVQFKSIDAMLDAEVCDAVAVCTPTFDHIESARRVLDRGVALMVEKPIARDKAAVLGLIRGLDPSVPACVMLNQRFQPAYAKIKEILDTQTIGDLYRVSWHMTAWYRPEIYFQTSTWRGTWSGEGGGLLLNQCIHNIDVLQWMLGMPASVWADCRFGKFHDIEVEDEVHATMNYANNLVVQLTASSGELPGINVLELVGDLGAIRYADGNLQVARLSQGRGDHSTTTLDMFGQPEVYWETVSVEEQINPHEALWQEFVDTLNGSGSSSVPLDEGLNSIELANALLYSSWTDASVELPLDANAYAKALARRETGFREASNTQANIDMNASYR